LDSLLSMTSLPLDKKIEHFVKTFCEFFLHFKGEVYLSWSGGKDSDVACDIIDKIWSGEFKHYLPLIIWEAVVSYRKPRRAFCNTGLEFPEIVDRVKARSKSHNDVDILKPMMGFTKVIKEIGVAVGSKHIAMQLRRLKGYLANPKPSNAASARLYMTGIKANGEKSNGFGLSKKWLRLLDAPFPVSDKCCNIFKKEPFHRHEKKTGKKAVLFTTTEESGSRKMAYLQTGCNSYEQGKERCRPYSIFTEADTWQYADQYGMRFAEVYYDRTVMVVQLDGTLKEETLPAEKRTGCTFCMFGLHLEPKGINNRIQRLAISHPKYYDIIINKCGLGFILGWIGLPYKPIRKATQQTLFQ